MKQAITLVSILGLSLGSFINSCAYRIPRSISIFRPRSFCPHCKTTLLAIELVPIAGYVLNKGKCRSCGNRISIGYPIVELGFGLITTCLFLVYGFTPGFVVAEMFCFLMIVIAMIDFRHLIIPNVLIVVGTVSGLILQIIFTPESFLTAILSAALCGSVLAFVRFSGNRLLHKESMGLGDVRLAAVIGLFVGVVPFLLAVWGASVLGMFYGIVRTQTHPPLRGRRPESPSLSKEKGDGASPPKCSARRRELSSPKIPFGAFLAVSSLLVFLFKDQISIALSQWLT